MIKRYTREAMGKIWSDKNRYLKWLEVELAVSEGLVAEEVLTEAEWKTLKSQSQKIIDEGGIDPARVDFFEAETKHDMIAFTTALAERLGAQARFIHFGLTSSDIVDTALSLMIREAGECLKNDFLVLLKTLKGKALKYQDLPTIGRSHGIYAEPTSFGLKFLGWYAEQKRNLERLERALEGTCYGKLSGAVGVNAHFSPSLEKNILNKIGLKREPVSTQVIPRDRHAELLSVLGLCGSSLERIATELRHLQRSEVSEVLEGFKKGQKGSSAMPHKRNPISSENITGCARMLRAYAQTGLENISLWHERDISHSAVERITFPDAFILLDYALSRMNQVLEELELREDQVQKHLDEAGARVYSGHFLLALIKKGVEREKAYGWIQECALKSLDSKAGFIELLSQHAQVKKYLTPAEIKKTGSLSYQLRNVGEIYKGALKA